MSESRMRWMGILRESRASACFRAILQGSLLLMSGCQASDWGSPPPLPPKAAPLSSASSVPMPPPPSFVDATPGRPRLFLSADVLKRLRARAAANAASWSALRARCDDYLDGRVEYPDGADSPGKGNIGEGYQGQGYFGALLELSLCYQIERGGNAARAPSYATKAIEVLTKMTEKEGPHAPRPEHDSVYGIRFYGVGMALAYDWLHSAMSPSERQRVYEATNRWIESYEKSGFGRNHPQGNYFAGYYAAKALAALATEGDNPKAAEQWNDFLTHIHREKVAPFYAAHLAGGGWPEGWAYGTLASLNMSWPSWAARTAKGIDLVRGTPSGPEFSYPIDQARHLMHFSWPSRKTLDDRGTHHAGESPSAFNPMLAYATWGFASMWGDPIAPAFHRFAREVKEASGIAQVEPWLAMLLWDEQAPDEPFDKEPRSYLAKGMQSLAMRSSWDKDAVWASFSAGPYVNNPDSGEMLFDQGSLSVVRGDRPLLVYAPTRLVKDTKGSQEATRLENQVYASLFGDKADRALFNVYYAKPPNAPRHGQIAQVSAKTAIGRFEDRGAFVIARGDRLEEAYRPGTVASWTRQIVFFRPSLFVIDDRTEAASANADQWLAFHLGKAPRARKHDRIDIGGVDDEFAGTLFPLLPRHAKTTSVDVFGAHKVWRVEVRPPKSQERQRWLTAFDASASAEQIATASLVTFSEGKARGAAFRRRDLAYVLVSAGDDTREIQGAIAYAATGPALHVVADVTPGGAYGVSARSGTIRVVPDGAAAGATTVRASPKGVLAFRAEADGRIDPIP